MTNRSKAVFWVVAVFVTGGLFGGAVAYWTVQISIRDAVRNVMEEEAAKDPRPEPPTSPAAPVPDPESPPRPIIEPPRPQNPPRDHEPSWAAQLRRMARFLHLSDSQRLQVRRIFQETKDRYQAANRERNLRQRQIRRDMLRSLRTILGPEQRKRFDRFMRRMEEQHRLRRQQKAKDRPLQSDRPQRRR